MAKRYLNRRQKARPLCCITYVAVYSESIADEFEGMKGEFGFRYRAKICVLAKCLQRFPGNVVMLDSDTIIQKPIQRITSRLSERHVLMHRLEFRMRRKKSQEPYLKLAGFRMPLARGVTYSFGADSRMYNAGVIGLHETHADLVDTALEICDALLRIWGRVPITEQLAFSEVFRIFGMKILETRNAIVHYCRRSQEMYMHKRLARWRSQRPEIRWELEQPIPYSYARVLLAKILRKIGLEPD